MSYKVDVVEHTKRGGLDLADLAFVAVTAGAGAVAVASSYEKASHDVVVRDDNGHYGRGSGATKQEAIDNAKKDLHSR